jgi:hypothetical protein
MLRVRTWRRAAHGDRFQVPSLAGVAWRVPSLHDGCAATLADSLRLPCGGQGHGAATPQLTPGQLADLVAFLDTL